MTYTSLTFTAHELNQLSSALQKRIELYNTLKNRRRQGGAVIAMCELEIKQANTLRERIEDALENMTP